MKKENHFPFTDKKIQNIELPAKSKKHFYDTKSSGLELRVSTKGTKTFYTNKWFPAEAKAVRICIGKYPSTKLTLARKIYEEHKNSLARGVNPLDQINYRKQELSLGDIHKILLEDFYKTVKPKSYDDFERLMQTQLLGHGIKNRNEGLLFQWRNKKLSNIKKLNVIRLRNKIAERNGKATANYLIRMLCSIFNKAKDYGFKGENPASSIPKYKINSRTRKIEDHEIQKFLQVIFEDKNKTVKDIILLLLLTGVRKSQVLSMSWNDIDLDNKQWHLKDTKNNTPQVVELVDSAIEILTKIKTNQENNKFVFPSDSKSGHITGIKRSWSRIITKAKMEDLRIHDLRRTLGSWLANKNVSLKIIGKALHHKSQDSTKIYALISKNTVREKLTEATNDMLKIGGVK